uniref:Uncharacterized protein n=1 Tax=Arundo donax TaxID=35708 RepID=A0A0A8YN17_ARUDO
MLPFGIIFEKITTLVFINELLVMFSFTNNLTP